MIAADLCLLAIVFTAGYCVGVSVPTRQPADYGLVQVRFGSRLKQHVLAQ